MNSQGVADYITDWINDYLTESGMKGLVVGISGGVDSAVTSTLAARTGFPVVCVEMPIHQHEDEVNRASKHIEKLMADYKNVTKASVDLTSVFDDMVLALPDGEEEKSYELALANTRARLRMTTLYYIAGIRGYVVAGTGNKVEDFGIGFFTKYGDGGVDISPIADLTKTEVFELGKRLGVIDEILSAKPTDGLWGDERTDEDQIGATYPELEWAMEMVRKGKLADDFSGREKEVFEIYSRLNRINQHKMKPIPVCQIPTPLKN